MRKIILIIFGVCCLMVGVVFLMVNFVVFPKKYQDYVQLYSKKYSLDESLVFAIIKAESNFDVNAVSKSNARGLMQLLPKTAEWIAGEFDDEFSIDSLFVPEKNIEYGCFYLKYLFDKFDDIDVVICAYNAGEGVVGNWLNLDGTLNEELINFNETRAYLSKVKFFMRFY